MSIDIAMRQFRQECDGVAVEMQGGSMNASSRVFVIRMRRHVPLLPVFDPGLDTGEQISLAGFPYELSKGPAIHGSRIRHYEFEMPLQHFPRELKTILEALNHGIAQFFILGRRSGAEDRPLQAGESFGKRGQVEWQGRLRLGQITMR